MANSHHVPKKLKSVQERTALCAGDSVGYRCRSINARFFPVMGWFRIKHRGCCGAAGVLAPAPLPSGKAESDEPCNIANPDCIAAVLNHAKNQLQLLPAHLLL